MVIRMSLFIQLFNFLFYYFVFGKEMNFFFDIFFVLREGFNRDVKVYVSDFMVYFKIVKDILKENIKKV